MHSFAVLSRADARQLTKMGSKSVLASHALQFTAVSVHSATHQKALYNVTILGGLILCKRPLINTDGLEEHDWLVVLFELCNFQPALIIDIVFMPASTAAFTPLCIGSLRYSSVTIFCHVSDQCSCTFCRTALVTNKMSTHRLSQIYSPDMPVI